MAEKGGKERVVKRSVAIAKEMGWVGWDKMNNLVNQMPDMRYKALVAFLFLSGLRISEALQVTEDMVYVVPSFSPNTDFIEIRNLRLLKRYKVVGKYYDDDGRLRYETQRKVFIATRVFPVYEPLVPYFMDYVWYVRKNYPKGSRLWNICRQQAHRVIAEYTGAFPHFFRAMRAIQLAAEYQFSTLQLKEFFKWEDAETVFTYAGFSTKEIRKAFPERPTF